MVEIVRRLITAEHRLYRNVPSKRTSVTLHSTGNERSTAKNERDWLDNPQNERLASWHYCVDENSIQQAIDEKLYAMHCGNDTGNKSSISIELCESGDRRKVLENGAELVADILKRNDIPLSKIHTHNFWSGKDCPRILINKQYVKDSMDYMYFITRVEYYYKSCPKWKQDGEKWLFDKGVISSRHDPLEQIDYGTLGTILQRVLK